MVKKQMKREDINKVLESLQRDIMKAMRGSYGPVTVEIAILVAYLIYKVRVNKHMNDSYNYIKSNKCTRSDNLRTLIDTYIDKEFWENLMEETDVEKYTNEQLLALIYDDSLLDKFRLRNRICETPESLVDLALKILDIAPGEKVADICSGLGSFLKKGIEIQPEAQFSGFEKDFNYACCCEMRLELLNGQVVIENTDAITLFKKSHRIDIDKIFANYPFGQRMRMILEEKSIGDLLIGKYKGIRTTTSSDWIYNTLVSELLAEKGKAVCLMSRGSTWNSQDRDMRQYFVENGLIECVISLPDRLFTETAIATSMIVISHNNSRDVRIVDGTKFFEKGRRFNELSEDNINSIVRAMNEDCEYSKVISYEVLKDNDFTLNMTRYLKEDIKFENAVAFGDVMKSIKRGAPFRARELDKMMAGEETNIKYLIWANIQDGVIEGPLQSLNDIDIKYDRYCVKNGDFLISRNNSPYKVGVAEIDESMKVIANGNMYVVTLDEEKVDPYYILAFFNSKAGNIALKSISVGTVITNISIKDLKELKIPVPELEVQRKIATDYRKKIAQVRELRKKLADAEKQLAECFDIGI